MILELLLGLRDMLKPERSKVKFNKFNVWVRTESVWFNDSISMVRTMPRRVHLPSTKEKKEEKASRGFNITIWYKKDDEILKNVWICALSSSFELV